MTVVHKVPVRPASAGETPVRRRPRLPVLLAAGWLAYVVAHRLLSGRWWLWLLPELTPPVAFVLVPALLLGLAAVLRRGRVATAALSGVALLLGAGLSGVNPRAFAAVPPAPPDAVRLVSWNTSVWNRGDDPDRFYRLLTERRADVYLLQEYTPDDDPARRDADLARLRREFPGYHLAARGELVTLSRFPILATVALPADPPAGVPWRTDYWEVKVLRTDLLVAGRTVAVYNAHILIPLDLSSPLRPTFYERRRDFFQRRRTQYRALGADLDRNRLPTLLAGDLNASPAMADLDVVRDRLRDAGRVNGSLYPTSWGIWGPRCWRLDWTFVSDGWRVHDYRLRDPGGMSDHWLQDVTVSLGGAR